MMFKCNSCGECCRNLDKSEIYRNLHEGGGICKYLKGDRCTIYSQRPLFCRVDECYKEFFELELSLEEYYELNYEMCKKLKSNKNMRRN